MKLTIELQRVGMSRVSPDAIPIEACIVKGSWRGPNLSPGLTDVECVKRSVESKLQARLHGPVEIKWIDRTEE